MHYHEAETTVAEDGSVRLEKAPFPAGHRVRITLVDVDDTAKADQPGKLPIDEVRSRLKGTVLRYEIHSDPHVNLMSGRPLAVARSFLRSQMNEARHRHSHLDLVD